MRWIRATERLPEDKNKRAARQDGNYLTLRVIEGELTNVGGYTIHSLRILEEWFPGIEWLDESIQDAPSTEERDMMLFAYKAGCIHGEKYMTTVGVVAGFDKWYEKVLSVNATDAVETPAPGEVPEMPMDLKKWMKKQEQSLSNEDAFGYRLGAVAIFKKLQPEITQLLADKEALRLENTQLKEGIEETKNDRDVWKELHDTLKKKWLKIIDETYLSLRDWCTKNNPYSNKEASVFWIDGATSRGEADAVAIAALTEQMGAVQGERDAFRNDLEEIFKDTGWIWIEATLKKYPKQ